jgi:hypothetical protein
MYVNGPTDSTAPTTKNLTQKEWCPKVGTLYIDNTQFRRGVTSCHHTSGVTPNIHGHPADFAGEIQRKSKICEK